MWQNNNPTAFSNAIDWNKAVARKFRDEVGLSRRDRRNIVLTFYFLAEA